MEALPILVWCEEERTARCLSALLRDLALPAVLARRVSEAVRALAEHPPSAVLVASYVGVPEAHARAACRRFREEVGERRLRLLGVVEAAQLPQFHPAWGVDDLLVLPCDPHELAARLQLLQWREGHLRERGLLRRGALAVDTARHEVFWEGRPVGLTLKEYQLLRFLLESPARVFTRPHLLSRVWGEGYLGGERTVDVHIRRLRAKLPALSDAIETVHGVGYRFSPALAAAEK